MARHGVFLGFLFLGLAALGSTALTACARPAMMPGSVDRGYIIYGHIWSEPNKAAEEVTVYLVDDAYDQPVATVTTDFFGKYAFAYHPPGRYRVESGDVTRIVEVVDSDIEVDLDLSQPDAPPGVMPGVPDNPEGAAPNAADP